MLLALSVVVYLAAHASQMGAGQCSSRKRRKGMQKRGSIMNKHIQLWAVGLLVMCMAAEIPGTAASAKTNIGADQSHMQDAESVSGNQGHPTATATSPGGERNPNAAVSGNDGQYAADLTGDMTPAIDLEVPGNLDFVIDPWNMSGCGQIYSKRFTIKNCGDSVCSLFLQGTASTPSDGVLFVEDSGEIYAQDTANVYLEMVFENGDTLIFSTEGKEHVATLEPGGELVFQFTGAVNEKAPGSWGDKEVYVILRYSVF